MTQPVTPTSPNQPQPPAEGEKNSLKTQFAAILQDAAKKYSDSKGISLEEFNDPPLESVDDLVRQIDAQNDKFAKFRARRQAIFSGLDAFLRPVELVGELVSGAAQDIFQPSQSIYGAVMYLVNAARDVSTTYDAIIELFNQLKDFTSRLDVYLKYSMSPALRTKLVDILVALFQVIVLSAKEVQRGRVRAYFQRVVGVESPVQPALDRLRALTLSEERQVVTDNYGTSLKIDAKQDRVLDMVTQVSENMQEMRLEHSESVGLAHQDHLREILEPSPYPEDNFTAFKKSREVGTGDWIVQDEGLQAWLLTETKFLWINGGPGTGKSYLATRLIVWAQDNLPNMPNMPNLAYFYFREGNPETRSVLQALRDVAYQLSENDAFYARQLIETLHDSGDLKTIASAFRKLFVQPLQGDDRERVMYVFLDGIDEAEADEMQELLRQLGEAGYSTMNETPTRIQFALIGKSFLDEEVKESLDRDGLGAISTIQISPEKAFKDVRIYIVNEVFRSRLLSRTTEEFRFEIIGIMEKKVAGLFILAKFMLAEVNSRRSTKSILQSLETYPKEIDGMLQTTLSNLAASISGEAAAILNEILQWTACAEEILTLEQLEAVLGPRFGEVIGLEESLRGQYACFFELEREDGLSTDDLVKEHERQQRHFKRERSPAGRGGQKGAAHRRFSSTGGNSPRLVASPRGSPGNVFAGTAHSSPHSSPTFRGITPAQRPFSPARTPDYVDTIADMEFKSNKATTYVSFFHSSVREFFRKKQPAVPQGLGLLGGNLETIGFDTDKAKLHILQTCLDIFTNPDKLGSNTFGRQFEAIKQYAAWYWQEHLVVIDLKAASPDQKKDLGVQLYRMLTERDVILSWTMMYEKNNEGLDIFTDKNMAGMQAWLKDAAVVAGLDKAGKSWAKKASTSVAALTAATGRLYAQAWLERGFGVYLPTQFCFKIASGVASLHAGRTWTQASEEWCEKSLEERITATAQWAGQIPQSAHWHRRIGSTFLILGEHNNALWHYNKALDMDNNTTETNGRIAFCLTKERRHAEALDIALGCAELEEKQLADGVHTGAAKYRSLWRLYKDNLLIANCYGHLRQMDEAYRYMRKAIDGAREARIDLTEEFEPWFAYLYLLATENKHAEIMELLEELGTETSRNSHCKSRLVDFLLSQSNKPMVMDVLPRAARRAEKADFLIECLNYAIDAARAMRDPLKGLYLRLAIGATLAYDQRIDEAISMYERISFDEYRPRGNIPTRMGHAVSFQKLATLYRQQVLSEGLSTPEGADWVAKLEEVQRKQGEHLNLDMPAPMLGSDVNVASIYLALFYRLQGRRRDANALLKTLIADSLAILSDADPANDEYALENLVRLFLAADDDDNARALARSMRKLNPLATMPTPSDSPVRARALEPKLPEIQTSGSRACGQCLRTTSLSEEFFLCKLCLECFCRACMDGVIRVEGNRTEDHRRGVVCKSDHQWVEVPPLERFLHRGQILFEEGDVRGFGEWKEELTAVWEAISPRSTGL